MRRTLRLAVCGSAPLTPALAGRVTEALGRAPLERYGSTEAGLDVSLPLAGPGGPGTVGLPLPGVQLRLVPVAEESDDAPRDAPSDSADAAGDGAPGAGAERPAGDGAPSDSAERPAGEGADGERPAGVGGLQGEVVLRGPQVFAGYWRNPEATAEAFRDGWFRTGDLGRLEPDTGYLRLTGRLKELIISGGMNVSPREVELALDDHPEVAEVAVAGVPSRRWGEEVTAWVVPTAGADPDERELLEHAARRLAPYKRPKRVYLVDELPRNSMGKVQRARLRPPDQRE